MEDEARIVLFDIETSPVLGWAWGIYKQNLFEIERQPELLAVSYKFLGGEIHTISRRQYTERQLLLKLHDVFNQADIIVGHNGDKFDIRMVNGFFLHHGMKPPSPYKTFDTLKALRSKCRLASNKLADAYEYLGGKLDGKLETGGTKLWLKCLDGDSRALRKMERYNRRDIELLEYVYLKIRPWHSHPIVKTSDGFACPLCGSTKVEGRGISRFGLLMKRRFYCRACGRWSRGEAFRIQNALT